jgi:iron complex transport system substrate-binding protein
MTSRLFLLLAVVFIFVASFSARTWLEPQTATQVAPGEKYHRIVSLAPSITEVLYALGLGDRVVGVTRYCEYPLEVQTKPKVGGYFDPNFEAILTLRPDLVILLEEHERSLPGFQKLGLRTHAVNHKSVEGILESFRSIARVCGVEARGRELARDLENRLRRIRLRTQNAPKPRVLMAVDRTPGIGRLADVYVAGPGSFSEKLIEFAGGVNAYHWAGVTYPVVSPEGILQCNPDVIIDLMQRVDQKAQDAQSYLADWQEVADVTAVKQGRVYAFKKNYTFVPGPRLIRTVEDLARLLHPEIDWNAP